ncbi:MAG: type II toxin-antitoxin system RatA family toxin [Gammaproteobacteria bacterium]|nr:type II toxin-antitoxin system RatA family toxin [Gammaproteobacteria bacterium]MCW8840724.1 type II toxin-antitoxin system RatA family toxin [Gammaproteobacteria bacterium]MCW8927645.1 type II toxin-antitoxin system RatA family toxin [Gammaproteobacteria bacterium]MCW8958689.1 type II toxin-antitoxin system RatA family toxin [Gammaproteobacteria bacterium]MCW8973570.1 type II toxin-antitoxin system RatA family toxin [Gammaproteobacteria bacterium]
MTTISKNALVPYSAREMFKLVNDIESYERFLPWCRSSEVLSQNEDEVRATIEIAHGSLHKSFTTCNRLQTNKMIEMRLEQGPFKHLEGFWRFDVLGERACKVSLDLDFEFSNKLIGMAMGPIFSQIANNLVDAFSKRAVEVYGKE